MIVNVHCNTRILFELIIEAFRQILSFRVLTWKTIIPKTIFVGAHISSLEPAKKVYHVIEGENVLVGCHAAGDVSIYWVKNDTKHPFRQNSTNLQLLNTTRGHAGDYICFGVNTTSMKNTLIKVIHLDVMCKYEKTYTNLPYSL